MPIKFSVDKDGDVTSDDLLPLVGPDYISVYAGGSRWSVDEWVRNVLAFGSDLEKSLEKFLRNEYVRQKNRKLTCR
jgi:hypothetical protein